MVFNTLTQNKVEFVPKNGNSIKWYICGPTGEDASSRAPCPPQRPPRENFVSIPSGRARRFFPHWFATREMLAKE